MKTKYIISICISLLLVLSCASMIVVTYVRKSYDQDKWLSVFMPYYNQKIATFEEENKTAQDVDVVFLGDSITDGYPLQTFYPEFNTLNRGIGGDTTTYLEPRLKVSAYDANPKVVVMLIGANNLKTMFSNYENILISLKQNLPNSKIVLLSIIPTAPPCADRNPQIIENNKKIKQLADDYNMIYIDIFTPLFDTQSQQLFADCTEDGVHPNLKGYEIMTKEIKFVLNMLLHKE